MIWLPFSNASCPLYPVIPRYGTLQLSSAFALFYQPCFIILNRQPCTIYKSHIVSLDNLMFVFKPHNVWINTTVSTSSRQRPSGTQLPLNMVGSFVLERQDMHCGQILSSVLKPGRNGVILYLCFEKNIIYREGRQSSRMMLKPSYVCTDVTVTSFNTTQLCSLC